jgi:hypothetical protein
MVGPQTPGNDRSPGTRTPISWRASHSVRWCPARFGIATEHHKLAQEGVNLLVDLLAIWFSCDFVGEAALEHKDSTSGSTLQLETLLMQAVIFSNEGVVHPAPELKVMRRKYPESSDFCCEEVSR